MIDFPIDQVFPPWGKMFNDRFYSVLIAVAVHGLLFAIGTFGLIRGVEYGMDASNGMSEVDLIAAPAPAALPPASSDAVRMPAHTPLQMNEDDIAEPMKPHAPPAPPTVTPVANAVLRTNDLSGPLGDGSSPIAGKDATTIHRAGSSGTYFKAGYYRNPPPAYPEEARRLKQQGRVLLEVLVTTEGKVARSRVKQSSGFPLLDASALKGVQDWKFRAATMGGLRIDILADIPIRFQLN